MLHFPGRIPISIHPAFWIFSALIGYFFSQSLMGTLIWIGIIFVSVLFHEFGHALTAAMFGQHPRIELVAMGGLTYHDGQKLPFWKQFLIVFDGPLFGFFLYVGADALLYVPSFSDGMAKMIVTSFRDINLFWTIVNLLPVLPLDGGQMLRIIFEAIFGARGFRFALIGSMSIALLASLFFFVLQSFIAGAIFFLLAFQSFDAFRKTRNYSEKDQNVELREKLAQGEELIQQGKKEDALAMFQAIRAETKQGMLYSAATQYAALLMYEKGELEPAYELLLAVRSELTADALCFLHKAAFDHKNYKLVTELSGSSFQTWPTAETALRNAYAHAALSEATPAVGWLQTAIQHGVGNLDEVLSDASFNTIRQDPGFQDLLVSLKKKPGQKPH